MCDNTNAPDDLQPDVGVESESPTEITYQESTPVATQPLLNIPALWGSVAGFFCSVANTVGSVANSVFQSNNASNASCMDTHEKNAECLRNMTVDPSFTPEQRLENAHQAVAEGQKERGLVKAPFSSGDFHQASGQYNFRHCFPAGLFLESIGQISSGLLGRCGPSIRLPIICYDSIKFQDRSFVSILPLFHCQPSYVCRFP
jgi:hypothetical protein